MRTVRSPSHRRRHSAPRTLIAPAVLATALLGTAAVGVMAGRPAAALSSANSTVTSAANQAAINARAATAARTLAKTPGWRAVAKVGPYNENVAGTLTAHSAKVAWSVWTGTGFTDVQRLVGTKWTRVPVPAKLTSYVRSAIAFDGDSATDFWLFDTYRTSAALRFTGGRWALQQIPTWVLQHPPVGGRSGVTTTVFGPRNVWVFALDVEAFAAHYNGRSWAKVRLPAVPDQVSVVSPDDIWALHGNVAWYWNGKTWTAIKIPKASGNPPEGFSNLTVTGPKSVWVWRTIFAPIPPTEAAVLFWNGTSWRRVAGTPADIIDSVAPDGAGGLWATGLNLNPSGFHLFYHLTRGRWVYVNPPTGIWSQQPENLTWIPGTRSLWGTATGFSSKGADGVLIKYGP